MPPIKIRYFVEKPGRHGPRYFWQPTKELRAHGFLAQRLSTDRVQALAEAERLNQDLDTWRQAHPDGATPHRQRRPRGRPAHRPMRADPAPGTAGLPLSGRMGVYIIERRDGLLKVGISRDPWKRLRSFIKNGPEDLRLLHFEECPYCPATVVEAVAHRELTRWRYAGEWFRAPFRLAFIAVKNAHAAVLAKNEQTINDDGQSVPGSFFCPTMPDL